MRERRIGGWLGRSGTRPGAKGLALVRLSFSMAALIWLFWASPIAAQTSTEALLQTAYDHFAGTWTGVWSGFLTGRPNEQLPITLVLSKTKKHDSLQIDYTYSKKGMKGYDHTVRYMMIDPAAATVRLNWKHDSKEFYKAKGLEEFVKAGYGTFTFEGTDAGAAYRQLRCTMTLTKDTFRYLWEQSIDGGPYDRRATWEMKRGLADPSLPPAP